MRKMIIALTITILFGCSSEEPRVVCKEFPDIKQAELSEKQEKPEVVESEDELKKDDSDEIQIADNESEQETSEFTYTEELTHTEEEPKPESEPEPEPKSEPTQETEPTVKPELNEEPPLVIEAIEQDFPGDDGDFIGDDGSQNYFYKKYESFEACQAAGDEILWDWDSDWDSYSCLGYSLYYTK